MWGVDRVGQMWSQDLLAVAAWDAAVGRTILVVYFRGPGTIAADDISQIKG